MRGDDDGSVTPRKPGSVLVLGEALCDLVIDVDGSVTSALGGAPYNTARALGRRGGRGSFTFRPARIRTPLSLLVGIDDTGYRTLAKEARHWRKTHVFPSPGADDTRPPSLP